MSSWLSLSLPNPFKSPDDQTPSSSTPPSHDPTSPSSPAGVKQDLSVITQSITRQLRGVASFLAPPPPPQPHSEEPQPQSPSSLQTFTGIKNDLVEIGGSFTTSLTLLSTNRAVTEISRFASYLLHFENQGDDEEYEEAIGITEEVIDFVREISLRPELWTDFPFPINNDFDMSDVQKDHASAIERLVPSLTVMRHKIDSYFSNEQFWIIYFILLLPRLNEDDSKLLSTPEIVEAREAFLQKLKSKQNTPVEVSEQRDSSGVAEEFTKVNNTQEMKHPSPNSELPGENVNAPKRIVIQDHKKSELFLEEEGVNMGTSVGTHSKHSENEDISFSDLEDDDNDLSRRLLGFGPAQSDKVSSPSQSNKVSSRSGSNEWVRLTENSGTLGGPQKECQSTSGEKDSEGEESNDWLTVDDTDFD